jgi:predicted  nucleic acid-binding Zn-ribbon protein
LTSELERIKILEGKISQIVDYVNKLMNENTKLKQQIKELKIEKKDFESEAKIAGKLSEELKRFEKEREAVKQKIETIISQIDELGI